NEGIWLFRHTGSLRDRRRVPSHGLGKWVAYNRRFILSLLLVRVSTGTHARALCTAAFFDPLRRGAEPLAVVSGEKVRLALHTPAQTLPVNPVGELPINKLDQRFAFEDAPTRLYIIPAFYTTKIRGQVRSEHRSRFDRF